MDAEFLKDQFAKGYISFPAIDTPMKTSSYPPQQRLRKSNNNINKWSGSWTSKTTRSPTSSYDIPPMTKEECTNAAYNDLPFCNNSGCTSHCSPVHVDFIELKSIKHCNVHGMSDVATPAVGRGTIILKCEKKKETHAEGCFLHPTNCSPSHLSWTTG
jgi:hypothetical protein